jgi:D-3-phosphoglycerate dehydrogenase / 2-oxoglutarate reductase
MATAMTEKIDGVASVSDAEPRILVADPIAADGLDQLKLVGAVDVAVGASPEELMNRIAGCDALVVRSETKVTEALLDAAPRLRVIGRAGVGVDNIDLEAATKRGVLVLNSPSGNTVAAAEHAVALMFALMRNIPQAYVSMREGAWDRKRFVGQEMRGKTLGIVGLGKIGSDIARMASAGLGMRVIGYDPLVTEARAEHVGAQLVDLETIIRESDLITVHVPITRETKGLIGLTELRRMKPGARILNVARGGIIDEDALAQAIQEGHIGGAALDVFSEEPLPADHPLRTLDGVVLTPHLGASTEEAQVNVATDVARQIAQYFRGEMPLSPVNAPSVRSEDMALLQPYLAVGQRIGSFLAQLGSSGVEKIECTYAEAVAHAGSSFLTAEVIRGFLAHFTDTTVNAVNAKVVAKAMGIGVTERFSSEDGDPNEAILVESLGAERHVVAGALIDGSPRITRLDEFRVDMHPEGTFLLASQDDRPGVIAGISTALAQSDINIARIDLGRDRPRGRAVLLMQVDDPISPELLEHLRGVTGLRSLKLVEL